MVPSFGSNDFNFVLPEGSWLQTCGTGVPPGQNGLYAILQLQHVPASVLFNVYTAAVWNLHLHSGLLELTQNSVLNTVHEYDESIVLRSCVSDTSKEKLGDDIDLGGGGSDMGPSAALTPAIWDKTIPYDGENFHLEYMDLEEFLMENGIPSLPKEDFQKASLEGSVSKTEKEVNVTKAPSVPTVGLLPIEELDKCKKEVVIVTESDSDIIFDVTTGECRVEDTRLKGCRFPLVFPLTF